MTVPDAASLHLTTGMTLEAWVNPSTVTSAWRDVIYKGNDNYYLEATSTNASQCPPPAADRRRHERGRLGTAALATNTWTFLAETYDGSTLRLYVNGTLVSSQAQTGSIPTSTNPLQIGGDSIYGQYFAGMIDDVRIYNIALTATQIQSDMNHADRSNAAPTAARQLDRHAVTPAEINLTWRRRPTTWRVPATWSSAATGAELLELHPDRDELDARRTATRP